ncbi:MAG: S1/P1 nuclease [Sphingobacteriales bacterium]|nr:S1/P1 nuclease [Sphingobacteriales bacterium]
MKKILLSFILGSMLLTIPMHSNAWGNKGHGLVAEIAFHFLDDSTKKMVKEFLGNMTIEEAANWMDDSKSNSYFDYMRSWHYLDIDKGEVYKPTAEKNILTIIHSAILELRQYKTIKHKDVRRDLLLLFHLVGDLHQPLHTGYAVDKGGNTVIVTSNVVSGNLHSIWDSQILEYKNINLDSCLQYYSTLSKDETAAIEKIDVLKWMYQSRSLLDTVYLFNNNNLDATYIDHNAQVIKMQLVKAGLRLGALLHELFNPGAPYTFEQKPAKLWGLFTLPSTI